uniref:SID1 transmembrane family member 1 n=1 Tax=Cacopsylla melanoneura TaxID=428564 RepID=A0A8D9A8Z7_9HEMI
MDTLKALLLSLSLTVLLCFSSCISLETLSLNSISIPAQYGEKYDTYAVNKNVTYNFEYHDNVQNISLTPARVFVRSNQACCTSPLEVVVRKQKSIYAYQIPYVVQTKDSLYQYDETSRTICPNIVTEDTDQDMIISISTTSQQDVQFSVIANLSKEFTVEASDQRQFVASPSEPMFYSFQFDSNTESVLLVVNSNSNICMTLSVQNVSCPVVDLESNVQYRGHWQTVTSQGGMLLKKSDFPLGLFIVFVVHSDDTACSGFKGGILSDRKKMISFRLEENISDQTYLMAALALLSVFAFVYMLAFIVGVRRKLTAIPVSPVQTPLDEPSVSAISPIQEIATNSFRRTWSADSSLDETDIDMLPDLYYDKEVFRAKPYLFVSDLSRKDHRILAGKAKLYYWNLITVAIFYSLPVVQLVLTYQKVLNDSGNQDLCYYNYLCSHPLWILSDFNHIISNVGYVFLGFLFILITVNRERFSTQDNKTHGIPHHFGFYYSLGMALIMEGVLSACYHVCPSQHNFQFDTSFMYIISVLSLLKIYQSRHPDINATSYSTFVALALIIFVGMVGTIMERREVYIAFTVIHFVVCLILTIHTYYMGRWSLNCSIVRRACKTCCTTLCASCTNPSNCLPLYPSRFFLLLFGNLFNWALAYVQLTRHPVNFGTYLLSVFMVNLCLYLMFYIIMKLITGERIMAHTCFYLIAAFAFWAGALNFFFDHSISWDHTPAQSRTYNQPCILLNFYDSHDVWHVLSAGAMFFSFMTLLSLDDDVVDRERTTLSVF